MYFCWLYLRLVLANQWLWQCLMMLTVRLTHHRADGDGVAVGLSSQPVDGGDDIVPCPRHGVWRGGGANDLDQLARVGCAVVHGPWPDVVMVTAAPVQGGAAGRDPGRGWGWNPAPVAEGRWKWRVFVDGALQRREQTLGRTVSGLGYTLRIRNYICYYVHLLYGHIHIQTKQTNWVCGCTHILEMINQMRRWRSDVVHKWRHLLKIPHNSHRSSQKFEPFLPIQ